MIKLTKDNNIIKINKLINKEIAFIDSSLTYQKSLNKELLLCMNLITNNSDLLDSAIEFSKNYEALHNIVEMLKLSVDSISSLESLSDELSKINASDSDVEAKISKFNEHYIDVIDDISSCNVKIETFLKSDFENLEEQNKVYEKKAATKKSKSKAQIEKNLTPGTLLISEIANKVVLPYTLKEVKDILKANPAKYSTVYDVINNVYTIPLKNYKNSSFARFNEAFKLVREREKGSVVQAFDLASELFFNYNLHPAVITACKNMTQLDVYLSCLEYNELEDFKYFKVIFQALPVVSKNNKTIISS